MSISNYTELQAAIANWMTRGDLTSRIPEFISLCEAKLNRKLRLSQQRIVQTTPFVSANNRRVSLPSDCLELLDIQVKLASADDSTYISPIYATPDMLNKKRLSSGGTPTHYTRHSQIEFNSDVANEHTVRLLYVKKWDIATNSTNWLLTNFPDAYLYGAMMAAMPYVKNDRRFPLWKSQHNEVMSELSILDERSRSEVIMDSDVAGLSGSSKFNVITG